jgi:hypothetical protein
MIERKSRNYKRMSNTEEEFSSAMFLNTISYCCLDIHELLYVKIDYAGSCRSRWRGHPCEDGGHIFRIARKCRNLWRARIQSSAKNMHLH